MPVLLLPLFLLIAILLAATVRQRWHLDNRREIIVAGALIFGLTLAAGTGALSLRQAIHPAGLMLFWSGLCIGGSLLVFYRRQFLPPRPVLSLPADLTLSEKLLITAWFLLAATLFLLALAAPPNSWDAMVYHLSRVAHWTQNRNVGYFATPITRELWAMPLAEYLMLHLKLLGGSDNFANLAQWAGWAGCAVGVSLVAAQLGASRKAQAAAALIAATIPMAILQATSTKNDLPTAFWLTAAVWASLKWMREGQRTAHALLTAAATALALFTKGSSYLFLPPFLLIALVLAPRENKRTTRILVAILTAVALLTGLFHLRTRLVFGRINPAREDVQLANARMDPGLFVSNLVRQSAVHLQTPSQRLNDVFIRLVRGSYDRLRLNFYQPEITHFKAEALFLQKSTVYNEYYAGNFLHFWLGVIFCLIGLKLRRNDRELLRLYILALILSYSGFVFYMRWQPWISRLHLPLFILGAPVIAVVLDRTGSSRRWLVITTAALLLAAVPWLIHNKMRPLVGIRTVFNTTRTEQYFLDRPYMQTPFVAVTDAVKASGCRRVGLIINDDEWEYPYWTLLKTGAQPPEIRHLNVANPSKIYEDTGWQPCAIIMQTDTEPDTALTFQGRTYSRRDYQKPLGVYLDTLSK
ncbi:MAG: hypothetical protein HGA80_04910 [Candidatus Omnitrophica bacterium]|nr:hypothetical protein [Candidatus Omnitrophota bacterium]